MNNNETITQVTALTPGDVINLNGKDITVLSIAPYGNNETVLTDLDGHATILANTNWF